MRFTGSNRVLTTLWPRDFKNPYIYPLEFHEVQMQVPCGPVRMPYKIRSVVWAHAGPMRGPYKAHRTQQTTGPVWVPVRSQHDCLRTLYERCVSSIVRHRLNSACTGPKPSKNHGGSPGMLWVLRGLALTGPVNYPDVSCNRGIISIL